MLNTIIVALLLCVTPAAVVWLCRRFALLGKIGPIMVLYAVGMLVGNLPFMPAELKTVQDILPNVVVPLAIPMMLFGCHFNFSDARLQLKVVLSGFLSVFIAVVSGYLLFGRHLEEGAAVGGIITGMYTGGTLNAAALQTIFNTNGETYVMVNSYDIIISFLYFVFLFSFGIKLFRRLYGQSAVCSVDDMPGQDSSVAASDDNPYRVLCTRGGMRQLGKILGVTLVVVALSAGVALLMPDRWFMVVFILLLTTLSVASSFIKPVRKLSLSYDVGMYLIYIFSVTIASMADFSNIDLQSGANLAAYMIFAVFVSLLLHAVICRLLRVDADSMVISSVAFINSPPFVPMVVAAMRNRGVLVTGLCAGIFGYALGNYFGVLMERILSLM